MVRLGPGPERRNYTDRTPYERPAREVPSEEIGDRRPARRSQGAATEKMVAYIQILIRDRDTSGLDEGLAMLRDQFLQTGVCEFYVARRLIDAMKKLPFKPGQMASPRQLEYIVSMAKDLGVEVEAKLKGLTFTAAGELIDQLKAATHSYSIRTVPDGIYVMDDNIYKVYQYQGRPYVKKLVKLGQPREMKNGALRTHGFEMCSSVMPLLKPDMKLTEELANRLGGVYGCCINCGLVLTKDTSIDQNMGDWCRNKMFGRKLGNR